MSEQNEGLSINFPEKKPVQTNEKRDTFRDTNGDIVNESSFFNNDNNKLPSFDGNINNTKPDLDFGNDISKLPNIDNTKPDLDFGNDISKLPNIDNTKP